MNQDYLKDIQDIKTIMSERTRFLSLSGLSGILSGTYALIGAYIAYKMVRSADSIAYQDLQSGIISSILIKLLGLAAVILTLSILTAYFFTSKKAKERNEKMWTPAAYKALKSFCVPLFTGGIFILLLIYRGEVLLISPATLIFYGIALYSASNYTHKDVGNLGILEIILGLISMPFPGTGIYFWLVGFGILHIVYGTIMYFKYDRQ